jgi:hypothetical protein
MANTPNDKRLFEYIHRLGEVNGHKGLYVFDNTGPNAEDGKHYLCFLQGGICFEIHKDKSLEGGGHWVDIQWQGPFAAESATDIIATLLWLGHQLPKQTEKI